MPHIAATQDVELPPNTSWGDDLPISSLQEAPLASTDFSKSLFLVGRPEKNVTKNACPLCSTETKSKDT